jgi:hypothetical protein
VNGRSLFFLGLVGLGALAGVETLEQRGPAVRRVVLVATTEIRARVRRCGCQGDKGPEIKVKVIAPCSCKGQSNMVGDIALPDVGAFPERSAWLEDRRATLGSALYLDSGDLLFPRPSAQPWEVAEWRRRADLLVDGSGLLGLSAYTVGERDLALGRKPLEAILARAPFKVLSANLVDATTRQPVFASHATFLENGVTVGVVGIFDPPSSKETTAALARAELVATDPVAATRAAVAALRAEHADVIVLLAHQAAEASRALVREVGDVDVVIGSHSEVPSAEATAFGGATAFLCPLPGGGTPVLAKLDYTAGARGVADADLIVATEYRLEALSKQQREQRAEREATADPERRRYLDQQIAHVEKVIAEAAALLPQEPHHRLSVHVVVLDGRSWKKGQSAKLNEAIERFKDDLQGMKLDPELLARLEAPAKLESGHQGAFVTAATCVTCHVKQAEVWKSSLHANAWQSLVKKGNEKDPECVRCHSLGFREPGGYAEVTRVQRPDYPGSPTSFDFRNVQCESCHGPRADHPREKGVGIHIPTTAECQRCHDAEHDPTFASGRYAKIIGTALSPCIRGAP